MAKKLNEIIGIDLGLHGGITLLINWKIKMLKPTPVTNEKVWKKIRARYDIQELKRIIEEIKLKTEKPIAVMERLRAIPNQSSQTWFSLWFWSWLMKWLLVCYWIEFIEIEPRQWQDHFFWKDREKNKTKEDSKRVALEKFKGTDFTISERAKVPHDWLTDSALIALYWKEVIKTI